MSVIGPLTVSTLSQHVRRLAPSFIGTSISIGVSMFVGDAVCQSIQFTSAKARILEAHETALKTKPSTPPPNLDILLRADEHPSTSKFPPLSPSLQPYLPSWYDFNRGCAMFATGCVFGGPFQFTLQRTAEHLFPGRATSAILKKMSINMGTAPLAISSTFYLINHFQGGTHATAVDRITNDLGTTYVTGFAYWPFVSFLNLRFVSVGYRPVVGSIFGAVWNVFISHQANSKKGIQANADIVVNAPVQN